MNDSVQLPGGTLTGPKLATQKVTVDAVEVHREEMVITGSDPEAIADVVDEDPGSDAFGLPVREIPSAIAPISGRQEVTDAAAALPDLPCRQVVIRAPIDNQAKVYIGGPTVDADSGYELNPGDPLPALKITNLNKLSVIAALAAGDEIHFLVT